MTPNNPAPSSQLPPVPQDEGGLRAPPGLSSWGKAWWWFDFIILVKLARLRFIAILVAIGVVITQWDTLIAYYEKWTRPKNAVAAAAQSDTEYFCPMHPSVIRDNGNEKCPVCFMPLSKRKKGEVGEGAALPAGVVNRVQLSPYRIVLAGVQTSEVTTLPLTKEINAVGFVEFNERGLKSVSARAKGRIDELMVNETGQMVAAGDILASLYSPDLNVTVQNLVDANRRNSAELLASSRQRLLLLGVGDDQIDEILKSGNANSHLRIRSPISGHVIKKYVREGQYVEEGSPLYDIADLSSVWIQAQIYEDDMVFLPVEQSHKPNADDPTSLSVTATTRAFPGESFRGTLAFVYPHVDQQSRTVTVRIELKNPGHRLRPGMTATIALQIPPSHVPVLQTAAAMRPDGEKRLAEGRVLAIPESAVIDTGRQTIVYREALPGVFDGVLVTLGPKLTGPDNAIFFPVTSGLQPGDMIVASGSFLVDAETRLNPAAGSIYFGGSGSGAKGGSSVTTARPSTPENQDAKLLAVLKKLSPDDRRLVEQQKFCPILPKSRLGSMGTPIKLTLEGQPIFVCCAGCVKPAKDKPAETVIKAKARQKFVPESKSPVSNDEPDPKLRVELNKLTAEDRQLAIAQRWCPVMDDSRLGSMGVPVKVMIDGKPVFLCCEGCQEVAMEKPKETLVRVQKLTTAKGFSSKESTR
jgi:Cu(I)/Ag(I) efflux system membrane fusion protein